MSYEPESFETAIINLLEKILDVLYDIQDRLNVK